MTTDSSQPVPDVPVYQPPKARPIGPEDFDGYEFSDDSMGAKRFPDAESVIKAKTAACVQVARTGAMIRGCAMAGISAYWRVKWGKADPVWAEALDVAETMHRETCEASARKQCFEGFEVKKRAGRDPQGHAIYEKERKYGDPTMAVKLLAKMDPAYREKSVATEINVDNRTVNVTQDYAEGVMKNLLGTRYAEIIDVAPVPALEAPQ